MLTQNAVGEAKRLIAVQTVSALAVSLDDAGIQDDVIAHRDVPHVGADRINDTRAIRADYPPRMDFHTGDAAKYPEIEPVERSSAKAHTHVIWMREFRGGEVVAIAKLFDATMGVDRQCAHNRWCRCE